ncbi:MAG: iron-sulfur cluster assembly scaffold protein [Candidatus Hydrogenedentota bacterium]|nr:MAG: iron-sulfur cluster assembly scaffold protein [Candidatus Hydrogenedentota bacterium]
MNFEKFDAILQEKKNYGQIKNADVVVEYQNDACGDDYVLSLKLKNGVVEEAKYTTNGCSFSILSLEILCDLLKDKPIDQLEDYITKDKFEEVVEGYPPRRINYIDTALEVMKQAQRLAKEKGAA